MAKTVNAICLEVAFLPFEVKLELPQSFKYHTKVLFMLFNRFRIDEYIVQVNMHKSPDCIMEDAGHEMLECRWGVTHIM